MKPNKMQITHRHTFTPYLNLKHPNYSSIHIDFIKIKVNQINKLQIQIPKRSKLHIQYTHINTKTKPKNMQITHKYHKIEVNELEIQNIPVISHGEESDSEGLSIRGSFLTKSTPSTSIGDSDDSKLSESSNEPLAIVQFDVKL